MKLDRKFMVGSIVTMAVLLSALIIMSSVVSANGKWGGKHNNEFATYHDQMKEILTSGTYEDLVQLREETGKDIWPGVDEETFEAKQEWHAAKTEGNGAWGGRKAGCGCGGSADCGGGCNKAEAGNCGAGGCGGGCPNAN